MEKHAGLSISLSAAPEDGRWDVRESGGEVIGQIQEVPGSNLAHIVAYEGYTFLNRWEAAYALAFGVELSRLEMRMIGY